MNKLPYFALDYYDRNAILRIIDKYGMDEMEAVRAFLQSETHAMLEDAELSLWDYPERAIFDMWEAEKVTGDPRNSVHVRSA